MITKENFNIQFEKLKKKSFCPGNSHKSRFNSCSGNYFCGRMCSVRKTWDDLDNNYQKDLINKIKTQYLILP